MDTETMTVVSGEPRSGTSLMMQTLALLGVPIVGDEYPGDAAFQAQLAAAESNERQHQGMTKRMERSRHLNPRGFWEVSGVVMQGVRFAREEFKGKAIKIITHGLYERCGPYGSNIGTPPGLIDKIVFCVRNPEHIGVSQKDLSGQVEIVGPSMDQWINAPHPLSPTRYIRGMGAFLIWLGKHEAENFDAITPKMLIVDYEEMHNTDENFVLSSIANHLGIRPGVEGFGAAAANIDPLLRRSTEFEGWSAEDMVEGNLATRIYNAIRAWDKEAICSLVPETQACHDYHRKENCAWTDDAETWVNINPTLARQLAANLNGVRDNLVKSLAEKRRGRLIPDACDHYSRGNKEYSIERPDDLGPLTRQVVLCGRDDKATSVELCKLCWQRGSTVDGVQHEPEMAVQGGDAECAACTV